MDGFPVHASNHRLIFRISPAIAAITICGMSHFRRIRSGPTYFFTVVAYHRRPILCDDAIRSALRTGIGRTRTRLPFTVDAIVLMPDHLHCIWTLPSHDLDISTRWAQIKHHVSWTCRGLYDDVVRTDVRKRRGEAAIWQRRFYEHMIRNELELERYTDYIHYNPVKHGHAASAAAWPYSSFGRYVREGVYAQDWGGTDAARGMNIE